MRYATTPCLNTGCPNIAVKAGRCKAHEVQYKVVTRRDRLPADWNTRRIVVLNRDKYICYLCDDDSVKATDVDHVVAGDDHSLTNLKAAHRWCHQVKTGNDIRIMNEQNKIKYKKF
jgi:5-methylcytosine-specific restriction protein A